MSQDTKAAPGHRDDDDGEGSPAPWDETTEARQQRLKQRLKDACRSLRDDFDSVQIVATSHRDLGDESETSVSWWGSGNWYARASSLDECLRVMRGMMAGGDPDDK